MNWRDKKEELIDLIINQKISYQAVGRYYGITGTAVKSAALRLGIELPARRKINPKETFHKGIYIIPRKTAICINCGKEFITYASKLNKYCSLKCEGEYKHKIAYKEFCEGNPKYMKANWTPVHFKKDIMEEQNNKCAICGMPPLWNGKDIVFIADHIDGNAANNVRSNIRCICPNCDSQLNTYKYKNKYSARNYYRYHRYDCKKEITSLEGE